MHLYGENVEMSFFSKCIRLLAKTYDYMCKVVKLISYNQSFVPWGLYALVPGLYTCIELCNF